MFKYANAVKYSKGFTDAAIYDSFHAALMDGDCTEVNAWVKASGAERLPVDCMVFALPDRNRDVPIMTSAPFSASPVVGDAAFMKELQLVTDLAILRDTPMSELGDEFPLGLRELSFVLKDAEVIKRTPGQDYGTDEASFEQMQAAMYMPGAGGNEITPIITLRDAATYVHDDDPIAPWERLANHLLKSGTPRILPAPFSDGIEGMTPFTVMGAPWIKGLLGEALRRLGALSFRMKWQLMYPRPEQMSMILLGEYLPQAYPEGSPTHPSRPAMHSYAAHVMRHILLGLFDGTAVIPETGRTVSAETKLLADNIGMFRIAAGVHYMADHTACEFQCQSLANKIIKDIFG